MSDLPFTDYYVFASVYDDDHSRITAVAVATELVDLMSTAKTMDRLEVVKLINDDKIFRTILQNAKGQYDMGDLIHVFNNGNDDYIRTDRNNTSEDNLRNLPEL